MAYKPLSQTVTNGKDKEISSSDAIFEALKLKLPKPSVDGTNGQLLARGASADDTSWVNPPATGANTSLSNLSSVAINDNLAFNKATAAILSGSDAKATQANHDFTIRAGNTGSAVNGGNLNLYAGTSGSGNGGSIYLRLDGGSSIATRRIYFIGTGGQNLFEIGGGGTVQLNSTLTVGTDNTYSVGAETSRLQYLWFTSTIYAGPSGIISGYEKISDNGAAAGSLTVRGGNAANSSNPRGTNPGGTLTLQGGDHPGSTGSQATPAAGSITVRGGNRTAGTGNGGSVTISGGTSTGGTAGNITLNTTAVERINIKSATEIVINDTGIDFDFRVEGDTDANLVFVDASTDRVGIGTATPAEKLEVNGNIKGGTISFNADANRQATVTNLGFLTATKTHDFGSISHGDEEETTITVTGAAVGDAVFVGAPSAIEANLNWCAYVSAADTVTLRVQNVDSSGSINPASATWRVTVLKT